MTLRNKTPEQRFEQIKRIMRKLEKRGQNNEKINSEYKKLLKNELNR
ncbi:hypothetical protein snork62_gp034 [Flavobacterium phage vB_FspS_snork6-2]|uniref:Uncharacterized protein n=1 Tax=Flavobacterium phage vB_FspS_snork6-2 TaxID=2686271 RepID=A0A6B9LTE0_9CAUD|nr:hypothetical protein snork62_gp034 [Flavobacterium phage vB_FspS_snork6-2]